MSKEMNQKTKLFRLYQILFRESDEDHPIPTEALVRRLEREGVCAERKSVYTDMEALRLCGLDIQCRRGKYGGWFVGERTFELAELKLLVDAVQSSKFITRKKSGELIGKLETLTSAGQATKLQRQVYVDRRAKTGNETVYYTIDSLHEAIAGNRAVTFRYFDYSVAKEKVYRREGRPYAVSPYGLIWGDENYYLVGFDHQSGELRHYRVDKMDALIVTRLPRLGDESCEKFDLAEYGQKHFHMFSGREGKVRLRCENAMVNVMLDRFGMDVMLIPDGEDHFTVTVDAVVSPQFYGWLFGLGDGVVLTGPDWAVREYRDELRRGLKR